MRATLAKNLAESDARARDNKRFFSGRVIAVNPLTRTVRLSVNEDEYLEDVPYTGQNPPNIGDVGDIVYASSSIHSARFTNPRLSSGNTTQYISGGVSSFNGAQGAIVAGVDWDFAVLTGDDSLEEDPTKLYMRVLDDGTTGITLDLPDPTLHPNPIWIRSLNDPAGGHTLARFGSENVDGAASDITMGSAAGQTKEIVLVSNGTDWFSLSRLVV